MDADAFVKEVTTETVKVGNTESMKMKNEKQVRLC